MIFVSIEQYHCKYARSFVAGTLRANPYSRYEHSKTLQFKKLKFFAQRFGARMPFPMALLRLLCVVCKPSALFSRASSF
jgi:hypothetical protein